MAYLWEKIRVQGGAYGAYVIFDDRSGVLSFLSYRDPNIAGTISSYDKAGEFLKGLDGTRLSPNELTKAIIGALRNLDAYQLPDARGYTSMMRYLTNRTEERRQKMRDEVLSTNGEDFLAFGDVLEKVAQSRAVAVLGSESALESAEAGLEITKLL
jgi:Zn-dependent M16 (insulinase) family peptidase